MGRDSAFENCLKCIEYEKVVFTTTSTMSISRLILSVPGLTPGDVSEWYQRGLSKLAWCVDQDDSRLLTRFNRPLRFLGKWDKPFCKRDYKGTSENLNPWDDRKLECMDNRVEETVLLAITWVVQYRIIEWQRRWPWDCPWSWGAVVRIVQWSREVIELVDIQWYCIWCRIA